MLNLDSVIMYTLDRSIDKDLRGYSGRGLGLKLYNYVLLNATQHKRTIGIDIGENFWI